MWGGGVWVGITEKEGNWKEEKLKKRNDWGCEQLSHGPIESCSIKRAKMQSLDIYIYI